MVWNSRRTNVRWLACTKFALARGQWHTEDKTLASATLPLSIESLLVLWIGNRSLNTY